MPRPSAILVAMALAATATACQTEQPIEPTFEAIVEQVVVPRCTFASCHSTQTNAAELDLTPDRLCDALINQPSCLFPDRMRVVPGKPEESFFYHKLANTGLHDLPTDSCSDDAKTNLPMPYGAKLLSSEDLKLVHSWIAGGAQCELSGPLPIPAGPAIASITATKTAPLPGEAITVTITLDQDAPEGGEKVNIATGSNALDAPLLVTVPAGKKTAQFEAFAQRPTSRFALRASTEEGERSLTLRVAGLEIAEVLLDPEGADDQMQWIKLRNRGPNALNLSGYQLRAGQGSYGLMTMNLAGTIPAGGCGVIGGPIQGSANSSPTFLQAIDFAPDLPFLGAQATGVAVFDTGAGTVGGVATPVDAMILGTTNGGLLDPDAEVAAPYCDKPATGFSASRTGARTCVQATLQPSSCL
jgi:hypothetical protein